MTSRPVRLLPLLAAALLSSLLGACSTLKPIPYNPPPGIAHSEETLPGPVSGTTLFGQTWLPVDKPPRAMVLLIHGTTEHSGLYAPLAEILVSGGYGVYGLDLQGWGQSQGLGKKGYVKTHDDYVRDVSATLNTLRSRYPGVPLYAGGESLGGTVLLRGEISGALRVRGLILADPGYKPNPGLAGVHGPGFLASFALWGGGMFGSVFPSWPTIPSDLGIRAAICSPITEARYLNDPYVSHNWLPAVYLTAMDESQDIIEKGLKRINSPVLIIHGEKDSLIPLESSKEILRSLGARSGSLYVIPGGCHASFAEQDSYPLAGKKMVEWLNNLTGTP